MNNFWKDKKVFLTGCTGFKGSWLSLILLKLGANLCGYSLEPETKPNLFEILKLNKQSFCKFENISDYKTLERELINFQPEIIIHMAAQALVLRSYQNPLETYQTNVIGTANLFEASKKLNSCRVILNVTSDKCYENKEWEWGYREIDELGGHDPYSSSKACAELVTKAYRKSFFNPEQYKEHGVCLSSVRAGNVVGGGDWSENRLIPDAIKAFSLGNKLEIRKPHSIRPWQHVLEPLNGYLNLCEKMYYNGENCSGAYNFGPNDDNICTVQEIITQFSDIWGENANFEIINSECSPHEANLLKLDISKAQKILGWKPKLNLQETLEMTAIWYKTFYKDNLQDIEELTVNQIISYITFPD